MHYTKEERLDIGRRIYTGEIIRYQAAEEYDIGEQTARNYMRQCHFWIITLDDTRKRQEGSAMQKNQAFGMSHTVKNGIFQMALRGRFDSLSAPRILEAWESEKSASAIESAEIDCSNLEYISSAGVRVLLVISKIPVFFNSRETSTAVLFSAAIPVLLCEDKYDKI